MEQQELIRTHIANLRAERKGVIRYYDTKIAAALGDVVAALLLERIVYFYLLAFKGHEAYTPFWKFRAPCEHPLYKAGDSFTEELFIRKLHQFDAALKTIGTKLKCPSKKTQRDAVLEHKVAIFDEQGVMTNAQYLVIYETDARRVTRYSINENLYFSMLQHIHGKNTTADVPTPQNYAKSEPVAALPKPLSKEAEIESILSKSALNETQKKQVVETFNAYKSQAVHNWRALLTSLAQKALQGELNLPETQLDIPKTPVARVKPQASRLDEATKKVLFSHLQSISNKMEWLMYLSSIQVARVEAGIILLASSDYALKHLKNKNLGTVVAAITGLSVVDIRVGSLSDYHLNV